MGTRLLPILRYARIPRRALAIAMLLLLADAAATLSIPLVIGWATANMLGEPPAITISLQATLAVWLALIVLQAVLRYTGSVRLGQATLEISASLRLRAYEHLQSLPLDFFASREHGDILSLLSEDIRRISMFVTQFASQLAPHAISLLGAAILIVGLDPWTGLAAISLVPLVLISVRISSKAARPLSREVADQQASHSALTEENLRLIPLIKSFTREQLEYARYRESNLNLLDKELQHLRVTSRVAPIVQIITGAALVGLVWIGSSRIETGELNASELVTLIVYSFVLFRPMQALGSLYGAYQSARGAAGRVGELFDEQTEPMGNKQQCIAPLQTGVRFHNVGFAYPGHAPVFERFNLSIPAQSITVLTGENGAGKTTLARMLMRFQDPTVGRIAFDEQDLKTFDVDEIRRKIGYVPQHVSLLNGSVRDNLCYGVPDADDSSINEAAHDAMVNELAAQLPMGMDSLVGPDGIRLSGGQKQRIALARALLKQAPILVLDEPTAMFDPENERELTRRLRKALKGKTVLIISHNQPLRDLADNVVTI